MADDPFNELLTRPKRTRTVTLAWDPDAADRIEATRKLVRQLERTAQRDNAPDSIGLELAEAQRQLDDLVESTPMVTFEFESIGTRRVDAILEKHPPSKEQQAKHRAGGQSGVLQFDPERYPAALIAATCTQIVTPSGAVIDGADVDPDRVMALFASNLSQTDQVVLFNAASLVDLSATTIADVGKD